MAKTIGRTVKGRKSESVKSLQSPWHFPLEKENLLYIGIAIGVIIVAYLLMLTGITDDPSANPDAWSSPIAISVAPTLLVLAYCALIPYALLRSKKQKGTEATTIE